MKVMLTGGSGFIGRHLLNLKLEDIEFFNIDRNKGVRQQIQSVQPDVFVHLAGISSNVECEANIGQAFKINVAFACEVYEEFIRVNPNGHFIFFSTGMVYDFSREGVITEDSKLKPQNLYAQTKLSAEEALKSISCFQGGLLSVVRLFNTSHKSQDARFFLPSVFRQITESKSDSVELIVGNIDIKRDFSTIYRTVDNTLNLIRKRPMAGDTYNFCSGSSFSLRSLAIELGKRLGKSVVFKTDLKRVRDDEVDQVIVRSNKLSQRADSMEEFIEGFLL